MEKPSYDLICIKGLVKWSFCHAELAERLFSEISLVNTLLEEGFRCINEGIGEVRSEDNRGAGC